MIELNDYRWTTPDSYAGFNPVGDFIAYTRTRDSSSILEESNYKQIFEHLKKFAADYGCPEFVEGDKRSEYDWVYDFRASHWACGWIETILVRNDAPQPIIDEFIEVVGAMADYPVFDESHYLELQMSACDKFWQELDLSEKVELCRNMGNSIFEARQKDYAPIGINAPMSEFYDFLN